MIKKQIFIIFLLFVTFVLFLLLIKEVGGFHIINLKTMGIWKNIFTRKEKQL